MRIPTITSTPAHDGITYLYVIVSDSGFCKIGISKNPLKRVRALDHKGKTPFRSFVSVAIPFSDDHARKIERYIHQKFAQKRERGEWFGLDSGDLTWLINYQHTIGDYWLQKVGAV